MSSLYTVPNFVMPYAELREVIAPGSLIFYSARNSTFSTIIRATTGVPPHVAAVRKTKPDENGNFKVYSIESTTMNKFTGKRGVQENRLSDVLANHNGDAWIATLLPWLQQSFDIDAAEEYCRSIDGRPYDYAQAIFSGLRHYLAMLPSVSFKNQLYCSELAAGLLGAGLPILKTKKFWLPTPTPNQLMSRFPIFSSFTQVKVHHRPVPLISAWPSKDAYLSATR